MSKTYNLEDILKKLDHKEKKEMKKLQVRINAIWHQTHKLNAHQTHIKQIRQMYESINGVKKSIDSYLD